jgi:hypothetical protein
MNNDFTIDIFSPSYGMTSRFEVVLFPDDEDEAPLTLGYLPASPDDGAIEVILADEYPEELFVFEFANGAWTETREDEDAPLDLIGWDVIETSVPA